GEDHPRRDQAAADGGHERGEQRAGGERGEEEAQREHLSHREDHGGDQPDRPIHGRAELTRPAQLSRARAKSPGSKGRRSSSASPTPISFTGIRTSPAMASAMPPLAVPSSLVSTIPDTGTTSSNI